MMNPGMEAEGYDDLLAHFAVTSDAAANAVKMLLRGKKK
jgi:hypothetical protein